MKKGPKKFMGRNFLLDSEVAKVLFHEYAEKLPIIDYHCHVPAKEIAEDRRCSNITELWLGGDHYKWRAMRSCGIDERYITGDASDFEKFKAYASCMPKLIGNPLYHWSHLELQRYFGYDGVLSEETAEEIWELTSDMLSGDDMSVKNLIARSNVELLCTTDDPVDSLEYHRTIKEDEGFPVAVLPAWRPDKGLNCDRAGYRDYISKLDETSGVPITDLASLKAAYMKRMDFFAENGCRVADHGVDGQIPGLALKEEEVDKIFRRALDSNGTGITRGEADALRFEMLKFFAAEYSRRGWVMQIHFAVLRNVNPLMFKALGPDSGYDVIGGRVSITELASLFGEIMKTSPLPRTVIYSINPSDNAAVAALVGAFQQSDGSGMARMMQGSAWWFNDNIDGMVAQMRNLANMSAFGNFLGMLTDSRSSISYPRHEYFRRILCSLIGEWVEEGLYPLDIDSLAQLVTDICYNNTKAFFGF